MSRRTALRLLGIGPRLAGGGGLTFLLRDDFTTAAAAPLASPRTAEPGPGSGTLTDTENKASISGGALVFAGGKASPVYTDPAILYGALTRAAGLSFLCDIALPATNKHIRIGLQNTDESTGEIVHFSDTATINIRDAVVLNVGAYAAATYKVAVICRTTGSFVAIKGGIYTNWTLLWPDVVNSTSSLRPAIYNYESAASIGFVRTLQLPAPFNTDYGLATQRLAGSVAAGTTFTHEANCVIEWTQTTVPSGGSGGIRFRQQDANNAWEIVTSGGGFLGLYEVVAGGYTVRGSVSTLANGHRVVVVADGSTIRVYSNNVLRFTYSSATNFQSATNGSLRVLGTSEVISDIVSWPRVLTSTPAALLDAGVA